jgi:hypothetical protein
MKKVVNKKVYWEIPSTVDVEAFLRKYPATFVARPKIDYFYSIIEHLSSGMDEQDLDANAGFINMNAERMQKFNHNYKLYLDHLLKHRFIRTDMKYIPGSKSKAYLLDDYKKHQAKVARVPVTDFVIRKKKRAELEIGQKNNQKTEKRHNHMTKWFNSKLQIDADSAIKMIEEMYPEQTGGIRGTRKGKPSDWAKRYKAIYAINKFANKEFYYSVDDNVGRFHSNLTNIKREIRNFITYDGQKLVNVDIKNSQPLFSTLLLHKSFYQNQTLLLNFYSFPTFLQLLLPPNSPSSSNHSSITTIIMLVESLKKLTDKGFGEYENYVNSGEFYKKLADAVYPSIPFDKQNMKTMIFTILFSNNRFIGQPGAEAKKDFRSAFPNVYELFRLIKVKNHRALAHLLQRIESKIMIEEVASRIAKECPNLPFFTIHDSLATTIGNEQYVGKIIKEEASKLTGLSLLIGLEKWDTLK